jgi:hypothetical protein
MKTIDTHSYDDDTSLADSDSDHTPNSSDADAKKSSELLDPRARTALLVAGLAERGLLPILDDVCQRGHVTRCEILGKSRARHIVKARQELWWCLRRHANSFSLHEIGKLFMRHHTSVLAGVRAHDQKIERLNRLTPGYAATFEQAPAPASVHH